MRTQNADAAKIQSTVFILSDVAFSISYLLHVSLKYNWIVNAYRHHEAVTKRKCVLNDVNVCYIDKNITYINIRL